MNIHKIIAAGSSRPVHIRLLRLSHRNPGSHRKVQEQNYGRRKIETLTVQATSPSLLLHARANKCGSSVKAAITVVTTLAAAPRTLDLGSITNCRARQQPEVADYVLYKSLWPAASMADDLSTACQRLVLSMADNYNRRNIYSLENVMIRKVL